MALIGKAVSEKMLDNNGHIYVYSPGAGTDDLLRVNVCVCVCVRACVRACMCFHHENISV